MMMEHTQRNETKLVGYRVTASLQEDLEKGLIMDMRTKLLTNRHLIANRLNEGGMYLVQIYPACEWTPDTPFVSIVAVEVSEHAMAPEPFIAHTLPGGMYCKMVHDGPEAQIGDTYDMIRDNGIGAERMFDFEYWTSADESGEHVDLIEIYIPL